MIFFFEKEGMDGVWDDVFINCDVIYVVVFDDDGKIWKGFCEFYMDFMCNDIDYVVYGGGIDCGVYQVQFVEVVLGKVLVFIG